MLRKIKSRRKSCRYLNNNLQLVSERKDRTVMASKKTGSSAAGEEDDRSSGDDFQDSRPRINKLSSKEVSVRSLKC